MSGPINTNLVSVSVNTNWAPGPVNTNWGPGLVNTNWGPGPGLGVKQRAGGQEYKHPDICRYPWIDIQRGISNFIPCQEVKKWHRLIVSIGHLVNISGKIAEISNLRSQNASKEILSDLVKER